MCVCVYIYTHIVDIEPLWLFGVFTSLYFEPLSKRFGFYDSDVINSQEKSASTNFK